MHAVWCRGKRMWPAREHACERTCAELDAGQYEMTESDGTRRNRKFKRLERLGHGAFGEVWKGRFDGELCAIKTSRPCSGDENKAHEVFAREAEILRSCCHSRIIAFRALVHVDSHKNSQASSKSKCGKWALVLEYATGGSLAKKVIQQMTSPGRRIYTKVQALEWALDVASALDYLHSRVPVVLHRDVKLSNILLVMEHNKLVAKLSDFGLHAVLDSSREPTVLNVTSSDKVSNSSHLQVTEDKLLIPSAGQPARGPAVSCEATSTADLSVLQLPATTHSKPADSSGSCKYPSSSHEATDGLNRAQDVLKSADGGSSSCNVDVTGQQQRQIVLDCVAASCAAAASCIEPGWPVAAVGNHSTIILKAAADVDDLEVMPTEPSSSSTLRRVSFAPAVHAAGPAEASADDEVSSRSSSQLKSLWPQVVSRSCSIGTEGTWLTEESVLSDSVAAGALAANPAEDECPAACGGDSSCLMKCEKSYDLTGQTGSNMYMAPEVFLRKAYNEKADVFSFGVVLYELLTQSMLCFSELPTTASDSAVTEWYAEKVSQGYRSSKPKRMHPDHWSLIQACWHQEPRHRPDMKHVVAELERLLMEETCCEPTSHSKDTNEQRPKLVDATAVARSAATPRNSDRHTSKDVAVADCPCKVALKCGCIVC